MEFETIIGAPTCLSCFYKADMSALRFVPKQMFFLFAGDALIITAAYLTGLTRKDMAKDIGEGTGTVRKTTKQTQ